MTLLSKIGAILLQITQAVVGLGPLIKMAQPGTATVVDTVTTDLEAIRNVIINLEAVGQALSLQGSDKLKGATPLIAQIILQSSIVANHKISNQDLFKQGCVQIGDGMAMILNSLDPDTVTSIKKAN